MSGNTKNRLLVIGFIVVSVFCYKIAISKTIDLKREYQRLQNEDIAVKNVPNQLSILTQKKKYYDSLLNKFHMNGTSTQNNLLKEINRLADRNNFKIVSFLEPHRVQQNDLTINTYMFTLEGDYNAIIKLIHSLEQETKFGEIISLHFEKKTNFKTSKKYLQAEVLLKNLITN